MKKKKVILYFVTVIMLLSMTVGVAMAEDGILFRRDISKTPDNETEKAAIFMMDFYVPAQSSTGLVGPIDNYQLDDGTTVGGIDAEDYPDRNYAKPLVSVYIDDLTNELEELKGGISFGKFDAFVGVSLDDGTSWKTTNLSKSADLSSFFLSTTGEAYPGDVHNVVHQVAGDQIFVAWVSKYCDGGTPLYKLSSDTNYAGNVAYFEDLKAIYNKDAVYLYDLFGVNGSQGSVDYELQGFPEIGEIPYSCVWTARGKLLPGDDSSTTETEATHVVWAKPERLTSGARDANLPAVDCAMGAGCILTWQEDPEGLRPGQGLGPGEGWSGAVANGKTDIWYSYISYADFDLVFDAAGTVGAPLTMADYDNDLLSETLAKPYVPMAMPTRLTDNNMCKAANSDPYCYIDFDNIGDLDPTALPEARDPLIDADFCADTVQWTTPGGAILDICVTDDGRVMNGRVAATRVRLNLKPYTPVNDNETPEDPSDDFDEKSAWVIMAAEETKALGDVLIDPLGNPAEEPIDIGKDMWYYSFDMFDHVLVDQGGMLNQPAVCNPYTVGADYDCTEYEMFPVQIDPLNGGEYYLTEIARRFALTTNSVSDIADVEKTASGLSAMLIYKQGIINQGGPADIFLRRVVAPEGFDPAVDNPYAFENMECADDGDPETLDGWVYTDGLNPNYLKGLCLSPAINISGSTIVECTGGTGNDTCADTFPVADDGSIPDDQTSFPKVLEWRQCDGGTSIDGCEDDSDLDDQTWDNPFDVAKGHRGFLDGDFVMMMYAWSPNWKANSVGNDHYNLYTRRSFDGGLTWTTTPADFDTEFPGEGTTAIENYCVNTASSECEGTEFTYGAGDFEQARNVSQLIGNKVTVLDPRYSPTGGTKLIPTIRTDWLDINLGIQSDELPYFDDEVRDRSKFFMVYETGDNTTVAEGEATPLDLYYSRATVYGDEWELDPDWYTEVDGEIIIDDYRWPWLENKADILSGEAGMLANQGGTFMYAVWNQWQEEIGDDGHELVFDSDIIFRRLLYIPDAEDAIAESAPFVYFLYTGDVMYSVEDDDTITMVVTARDMDRLGDGDEITEYEWIFMTPDGYEHRLDGCTGRICNAPARTLSEGWDGFGSSGGVGWAEMAVRVKDNDPNQERPEEMGNWSNQIKTSLLLAKTIYTVQLPFLTR
jgi:hypothetical protein